MDHRKVGFIVCGRRGRSHAMTLMKTLVSISLRLRRRRGFRLRHRHRHRRRRHCFRRRRRYFRRLVGEGDLDVGLDGSNRWRRRKRRFYDDFHVFDFRIAFLYQSVFFLSFFLVPFVRYGFPPSTIVGSRRRRFLLPLRLRLRRNKNKFYVFSIFFYF